MNGIFGNQASNYQQNGLSALQGQGQWAGHTATAVPKEIGYIDRISGLRSGLDDLYDRIEKLAARIGVPFGVAANATAPTPPNGIGGQLELAEGRLRDCFGIVSELDSKF